LGTNAFLPISFFIIIFLLFFPQGKKLISMHIIFIFSPDYNWQKTSPWRAWMEIQLGWTQNLTKSLLRWSHMYFAYHTKQVIACESVSSLCISTIYFFLWLSCRQTKMCCGLKSSVSLQEVTLLGKWSTTGFSSIYILRVSFYYLEKIVTCMHSLWCTCWKRDWLRVRSMKSLRMDLYLRCLLIWWDTPLPCVSLFLTL
jgi:hypothetical protein